jgi:hypothetical protein
MITKTVTREFYILDTIVYRMQSQCMRNFLVLRA